jgi:hypothetical protein
VKAEAGEAKWKVTTSEEPSRSLNLRGDYGKLLKGGMEEEKKTKPRQGPPQQQQLLPLIPTTTKSEGTEWELKGRNKTRGNNKETIARRRKRGRRNEGKGSKEETKARSGSPSSRNTTRVNKK